MLRENKVSATGGGEGERGREVSWKAGEGLIGAREVTHGLPSPQNTARRPKIGALAKN